MRAFISYAKHVHFRSRDKDGGYTIRSADPIDTRKLHAARKHHGSMFDIERELDQSFTLRE